MATAFQKLEQLVLHRAVSPRSLGKIEGKLNEHIVRKKAAQYEKNSTHLIWLLILFSYFERFEYSARNEFDETANEPDEVSPDIWESIAANLPDVDDLLRLLYMVRAYEMKRDGEKFDSFTQIGRIDWEDWPFPDPEKEMEGYLADQEEDVADEEEPKKDDDDEADPDQDGIDFGDDDNGGDDDTDWMRGLFNLPPKPKNP